MNASHKILALIPARSGSKRLPGKNMLPLNGKPLINYTIDAALNCPYVTDTLVTTDSFAIYEHAKKLCGTAIMRPEFLAMDNTPMEPVVTHAINVAKSFGMAHDVICLLQPTSPLRNNEVLGDAIEQFFNNEQLPLISGYQPKLHPLKAFLIDEDDRIMPVSDDFETPFKNVQSLPKPFMQNGAIYIIKTETFLKEKTFYVPWVTYPFYMQEQLSIDIDTAEDFAAAEQYLQS